MGDSDCQRANALQNDSLLTNSLITGKLRQFVAVWRHFTPLARLPRGGRFGPEERRGKTAKFTRIARDTGANRGGPASSLLPQQAGLPAATAHRTATPARARARAQIGAETLNMRLC